MNTFAPLGDRDFRLYFVGEVLSMAGTGLQTVALGWYLLERTGSATSVGIVWAVGLGSGIVMAGVCLRDVEPALAVASPAERVHVGITPAAPTRR